jgi:hypothetical protein
LRAADYLAFFTGIILIALLSACSPLKKVSYSNYNALVYAQTEDHNGGQIHCAETAGAKQLPAMGGLGPQSARLIKTMGIENGSFRIAQCLNTVGHSEVKSDRVPTYFHSVANDRITKIKAPAFPQKNRCFERVARLIRQPSMFSHKNPGRGEINYIPKDITAEDPEASEPSIPTIGYIALVAVFTALAIIGWGPWLVAFLLAIAAIVLSVLTLDLIENHGDKYTGTWLAYLDLILSTVAIIVVLGIGLMELIGPIDP